MKTSFTPGPWKMEIYLNEMNVQLPPHIVGLSDNHQVADCCGADEMDLANGRLIAAGPELLEACEAAVIALVETANRNPSSETHLKTINLCRVACDKARAVTSRIALSISSRS